MTEPALATLERDLLGRMIHQFEEAHVAPPVLLEGVDPSLLSSAWQKAIRRGDTALAQRAMATLHAAQPDYVWRRMRGIALEEVSVGDLELVAQILAIAGKQAARRKLGDVALALHLTGRLAAAPKCRTACDLLMWWGTPTDGTPPGQLEPHTPAPLQDAIQQARTWLAITARSGQVQGRWVQLVAGDLRRRDALLEQSGCPALVQFIVRRGSSTDALNSLIVPVYELSRYATMRLAMPDRMPSACEAVGPLPSYAYCLFSGPGRTALRRLLAGGLGQACRAAGISDPLRAVGHTVFQIEGGYCSEVLHVAHASIIRHRYEQTTLLRYGVALRVQHALRQQVRSLMPVLHAHRLQVHDARRPYTPTTSAHAGRVESPCAHPTFYMADRTASRTPAARSSAPIRSSNEGAATPRACHVEDSGTIAQASNG